MENLPPPEAPEAGWPSAAGDPAESLGFVQKSLGVCHVFNQLHVSQIAPLAPLALSAGCA